MRIFYIISFLIFTNLSFGQTFGTCPLDSGNVWVYDDLGDYTFCYILDSTRTFDDSLTYKIIHSIFLNQQWDVYVRYRYDGYYVQRMPDSYNTPNHERIYYKIGAKIGDSWMQPDPGGVTDSLLTEVVDTVRTLVFNKLVTLRLFHVHYSLIDYYETWSDDFGLMSLEDWMGTVYYLYCCIIDGVAYGDTTILGVEDISEKPEEFVLEQNYPNPFNPTTTITYQVPKLSFVSLKVYDVLGNEVETLVNEEKYPGRYTVNFSAIGGSASGRNASSGSRRIASGVYIYQLRVNDYISSKKMLLLK